MGLDRVVKKALQLREYQFDVEAALKAVVSKRSIDPGSELNVSEWLKGDVYFPEGEKLKLHHLYRSLDFLVEEKEKVQSGLASKLLYLFSMDTDVAYTTLPW